MAPHLKLAAKYLARIAQWGLRFLEERWFYPLFEPGKE
jgi:hypothetical protein